MFVESDSYFETHNQTPLKPFSSLMVIEVYRNSYQLHSGYTLHDQHEAESLISEIWNYIVIFYVHLKFNMKT